MWNLILMNDSLPALGFDQDRIKWLKEEVGRIREQSPAPPPALLFCHIPLDAYRDMLKAGAAKEHPLLRENPRGRLRGRDAVACTY